MTKLLIAVMCFAFLGLAGTAHATPITFEIGQNNSWSLGSGWGKNEAALGYATSIDPSLSSQSFALDVGDFYIFNFGTFTLDESGSNNNLPAISNQETNNLTITAVLDFDLPAGVHLVNNPGNAVAITGNIVDYVEAQWIPEVSEHCSNSSYTTKQACNSNHETWYKTVPAHCSDGSEKTQEQCTTTSEQADLTINFAPVYVLFSNGGQFTVDLSDLTFWTNEEKTITATVTLDSAPVSDGGDTPINPNVPISTPEPSTFLLLGAGLLVVGLVRKRIKR